MYCRDEGERREKELKSASVMRYLGVDSTLNFVHGLRKGGYKASTTMGFFSRHLPVQMRLQMKSKGGTCS